MAVRSTIASFCLVPPPSLHSSGKYPDALVYGAGTWTKAGETTLVHFLRPSDWSRNRYVTKAWPIRELPLRPLVVELECRQRRIP